MPQLMKLNSKCPNCIKYVVAKCFTVMQDWMPNIEINREEFIHIFQAFLFNLQISWIVPEIFPRFIFNTGLKSIKLYKKGLQLWLM